MERKFEGKFKILGNGTVWRNICGKIVVMIALLKGSKSEEERKVNRAENDCEPEALKFSQIKELPGTETNKKTE